MSALGGKADIGVVALQCPFLARSSRATTKQVLPAGTTSQQATSIVVQYIDGQPARIHEDFNPFAVEALRAHWPCSLEPLPVALR